MLRCKLAHGGDALADPGLPLPASMPWMLFKNLPAGAMNIPLMVKCLWKLVKRRARTPRRAATLARRQLCACQVALNRRSGLISGVPFSAGAVGR